MRDQAISILSDYLARSGDDMTLNQYQVISSSTMDDKLPVEALRTHALLGLAAEAGEVADIFQKQMQGHPLHIAHVREELGDVLWFVAALCTIHGLSLAEVATANAKKRKLRYPDDKFDPERSVNREANA
jgi:NTP pyrophosphatase (non-canonical NTP hydrolase)